MSNISSPIGPGLSSGNEQQRIIDQMSEKQRARGDIARALDISKKGIKTTVKTGSFIRKWFPLFVATIIVLIQVFRIILITFFNDPLKDDNLAVLGTNLIFHSMAFIAQLFIRVRIKMLDQEKESSYTVTFIGWLVAGFQIYSSVKAPLDKYILGSKLVAEATKTATEATKTATEGFDPSIRSKMSKSKDLLKDLDSGFTDRQTEFFHHIQDRSRFVDYFPSSSLQPKFSPSQPEFGSFLQA